MYVVIDWHILSDGNPKTNQKKALSFFARYAKKYGKQNNILYEICNEPNGNVTWAKDIKPYAKKVIKKIRKYDKKNIIVVGTPTWSQDVDVVAKSPLKEKNIVYSGNGGIDKKSASKWMKLLKKYKIGHIAWNISNKNETSALIQSKCGKTDKISYKNLSKSGKWIAKWWKK